MSFWKDKIDVIHAHGGTLFSQVTGWVLSSLDKVNAETKESKSELVKIGVPKKMLFNVVVNSKKSASCERWWTV